MELFFHAGPWAVGDSFDLASDEARHLAVLRKVPRDLVVLIDGRGTFAEARIVELTKHKVRVEILSTSIQKDSSRVRLCFALSKPPALEQVLRHVTELRVDSVVLLETRFAQTYRQWNATRWERIIQEACKQSQQAAFPKLLGPLAIRKYVEEHRGSESSMIVCDEIDRNAGGWDVDPTRRLDVFVGSEGGWSDEERALFEAAGAFRLGLGPTRLRAETAALVATTLVKKSAGEL